jgi:hypothetical protein
VRVCGSCRVGTSEAAPLLHRHGDTVQFGRVLAGAFERSVPCRSTVEAAGTAPRHSAACATATTQPPVAAAAQQSRAFICEAARETLGSAGGAEGVCVCGLASFRSIVVRLGLIKGVESLDGHAETAAFGKASIRVREQRLGLGFDTCGPCRSTVEAAGTAPRHCATATTQAATSYTPELLTPVACAGGGERWRGRGERGRATGQSATRGSLWPDRTQSSACARACTRQQRTCVGMFHIRNHQRGQLSQSVTAKAHSERWLIVRDADEKIKSALALKTCHDGREQMLPPALAGEHNSLSVTVQRIDYSGRRQVTENDQSFRRLPHFRRLPRGILR